MYATAYLVASLVMLGGSVAYGAFSSAAALGVGTSTGSLRIDHCEMTSGAKGGEKRVCRGVFRATDDGRVDERARADSEEGQEGQSIAVTRTLVGEYIEHGWINAIGAGGFAFLIGVAGVGTGIAAAHHARRGLKPELKDD